MRDIVIERLEELKRTNGNFGKGLMRWTGKFNGQHYQDIDFDDLGDEDLLKLLEVILKKYYRQM